MFRYQENVTFRMATVTGVDVPDHKIEFEDENQIAYDYLVLAGGATVNYFDTPGSGACVSALHSDECS